MLSLQMVALLTVIATPRATAAKVLHYSFDNATVTSGSVIADESGTSHTATVMNNDASTTGGRFGKALMVNGKSWLRVANPASITFGNADVTVMAWIKTTTVSATLFSKDQNGTHISGDKALLLGGNGKPGVFHVDNGWVGSWDSTAKINDGLWHHVAWVQRKNANGANEYWDCYIDGVAAATNVSMSTKDDAANFTISFCRKCAGCYSPSNYYGLIDEIKIFDTALDAAAVQLEYTSNGIRPNAISNRGWTSFE
jgi:hypothetical protein